VDALLRTAIREKRLVAFDLHGRHRVGEPHVYGLHRGVPQLLMFQVAGESRSGSLPGWRRANLHETSGLELTAHTFTARQLPTERQVGWDRILASVV
jgi:hypothetical protein